MIKDKLLLALDYPYDRCSMVIKAIGQARRLKRWVKVKLNASKLLKLRQVGDTIKLHAIEHMLEILFVNQFLYNSKAAKRSRRSRQSKRFMVMIDSFY